MKTLKILFVFATLFLLSSCAGEKVDPLQKSVLEELSDDEIKEVVETIPDFERRYNFIHTMVIISGLSEDSSIVDITYQRMIDFLDYRPDTAAIFPRSRQEWNAQYAGMDSLDADYVPYWQFKNDMITADLNSYDSLCCRLYITASAHVRIFGGKK